MGPVHRKFADLETKRPDRPKPAGLQVVRFRGEARTLLDGPLGSRPANGAMQGVESWTNPTSAVNYLQAATPFAENAGFDRSEEHTSELQSLMRISYAVFCLKKKKKTQREKII